MTLFSDGCCTCRVCRQGHFQNCHRLYSEMSSQMDPCIPFWQSSISWWVIVHWRGSTSQIHITVSRHALSDLSWHMQRRIVMPNRSLLPTYHADHHCAYLNSKYGIKLSLVVWPRQDRSYSHVFLVWFCSKLFDPSVPDFSWLASFI